MRFIDKPKLTKPNKTAKQGAYVDEQHVVCKKMFWQSTCKITSVCVRQELCRNSSKIMLYVLQNVSFIPGQLLEK